MVFEPCFAIQSTAKIERGHPITPFILCRLSHLVADQLEQWQENKNDGNDRDRPSDWPVEKNHEITVRKQK